MTPTEQADKLISAMSEYTNIGNYPYNTIQPIQCALVAVDILIDCTHSEDITMQNIGANGYDQCKKYTLEYWQDVKAELKQKLFQ